MDSVICAVCGKSIENASFKFNQEDTERVCPECYTELCGEFSGAKGDDNDE